MAQILLLLAPIETASMTRTALAFITFHLLCRDLRTCARCRPHDREAIAMKFAEFKKAGHWPTLLAAFLYFDISFMAWVALGPLMVYIAHDMNLAVSEKFTLVAIPVLAG